MIEFRDVHKTYGSQTVLDGVSLRINAGERIGIVGPNGAGKSTLFGLITGEFSPDRGDVSVAKETRVGYLRQELRLPGDLISLVEYAENSAHDLHAMRREIEEIEHTLHVGGLQDSTPLLRRLGELQSDFEHRGGYQLRNQAEQALCGLGFAPGGLQRPLKSYSGGWQMRAELARILVAQPDVLLLDEPSNYLDLPAVEWLKNYLDGFHGTLLLISHDRYLLNQLTNVTLETANGRVTRYPGNCAYYLKERETRYAQLDAARKNQDRRRAQIERFIERFRAKNTKASQVQSRINMLEKMEEIECPEDVRSIGEIRIAPPPHCGTEVLRLEDGGLTYDGERWIIRHVNLEIRRGDKTALVGLNGLGKTTLLRILAGVRPPSEGARRLGHQVIIGYQSQEFAETLAPDRTAFEIIKATTPDLTDRETRTILGSFGFSGERATKLCGILSGGEKIRLAFARLLVNPPNLLILDEPTTHLDMAARAALEEALAAYEGTVCFVSHDVEFVRRVATSILAMTPPGVTRFHGNYDYYKEKLAELSANAPQPTSAKPSGKEEEKAARIEKARRNQEVSKRRKSIEKALTQAEKKLDQLHEEQAYLVTMISAPSARGEHTLAHQRLSAIQGEIAAVTIAWEKAAEELDELNRCANE